MKYPRVSIIILNWNGWKDTIECLESLYRINYPNYDVIVLDNDSKDESIEKIKEYCNGKIKQILPEFVALRSAPIEVNSKFFKYNSDNKPIEIFELSENEARNKNFLKKDEYEELNPNKRMILIKNKDNYGFAGGNNVGIKFALDVLNPKYVLLLNNDTVVDKDFLIEMVKVAESDEKIGIVGSKIYYYDYNGRDDVIWVAGGGYDLNIKSYKGKPHGYNKVDDGKYNKYKELDIIIGCCMLIKNSSLEHIGLFDENYFLYEEENDLCVRAKRYGWKLIYCPKSILWHKVAASSGGGEFSPTKIYYQARNRILFIKKHNSSLTYVKYLFYYLQTEHIKKLFKILFFGRKPILLKYYYKGIFDGIIGKFGRKNLR